MEPIFICEFTPTVPMIAARIRKYSKARCVFLQIIGIGLFTYMLFCTILSTVLNGFDVFWLKLILFSLAVMLFCVFFPRISAFFAVKNYRKDTSGTGSYKIAFGDHIEVTQGTVRAIWEYSDITAVYHLKYSYELVKSKRMALIVEPNSFTHGTFEEFKKFLQSQCPDLTIPE